VPEQHNWRTDGPKWIVWGRAVSCLHNQAPNWNTIGSLWWNTLTSGTSTFLHVLILWVPEQHNWRTDVPNELLWGEQSHAYIIKATQSQHNWLLVMEYTHIRYSDITTCLILWVQSSTTGDGWVSKWIVWGEQSHAYHNQHPIETICSLWWNTLTNQVQWHSYVYWFCECQSWRTGTDGLQMNCVRESSLMLT